MELIQKLLFLIITMMDKEIQGRLILSAPSTMIPLQYHIFLGALFTGILMVLPQVFRVRSIT